MLAEEAVCQLGGRPPELPEREGCCPHLCLRGHWGHGDVSDQREAVGEVPAKVIGVLVVDPLEVPVDEGHLQACLTGSPEHRSHRRAGVVHDFLVEVGRLLRDGPELLEHLSLVAYELERGQLRDEV